MTVSGRNVLQPGDVLLLCTDGIWSNLRDSDIAGFFREDSQELRAWLEALGRRAVQASAPFSDNSTAAVLRWHG
jgi:protein phosphatase